MKPNYQLGAYYTEKAITALLFAVILFMALHSVIYPFDYVRYEVSDWLINYQGGFVRRGLIGELLLQLEHIRPYNVRHAILGIEIIFLYSVFRRHFQDIHQTRMEPPGGHVPSGVRHTIHRRLPPRLHDAVPMRADVLHFFQVSEKKEKAAARLVDCRNVIEYYRLRACFLRARTCTRITILERLRRKEMA